MKEVDQELINLIQHGREERNLEYKRGMLWAENAVKAKISKAALGVSNIRDGGYVVIGVDDESGEAIGMSQEDFDSYNQDDVQNFINSRFADPFVEMLVSKVTHDEKRFVVIQIREFSEVPTICKGDWLENLTKGVVYTRSRKKHETIQVPSQVEMREILDMATTKGIRKLQGTIHEAGLRIVDTVAEDEGKFREQLNGL